MGINGILSKLENLDTTITQVTGSILQCMDQVDDVCEYLPEQTAQLFYIHRLLTWLKPFQTGPLQRHSGVDVRIKSLTLGNNAICTA